MDCFPLVTIAALNYNNSTYVIDTLESIKDQLYPNIELIIVDDCSTDNSVELIERWLKNYKKPYQFIIHEKNAGVCAVCNTGLKNASGKYFSILATDDIIMPEKISIQVEMLEKASKNVCGVYSDAYLMKEDGSPRYGWFIQRCREFENLPSGNIFDELMDRGNFIPAMSVLCKISCLKTVGYFDESLPFEDFDMWLRLAKNHEFLYSGYVSAKYRLRKGSLSGTFKSWDIAAIKIFSKHLDSNKSAMINIEHIAQGAFYTNNKKVLEALRPFKNSSAVISKAIFYSKFHFPSRLRYQIKLEKKKVLIG